MSSSNLTTTIGHEKPDESQDPGASQAEGTNTLAPYQPPPAITLDPRDLLPVKTAQEMARHLERLQDLKDTAMVEGYHYGPPFPGSDKSVLHKPGMELILGFFGLHTKPVIEHVIRQFERTPPFLMYEIRSHIVINGTEIVIAQGLGSANTYEVKYRWRNVPRELVPPDLDLNQLETTGGEISEPDWVIERLIDNGITSYHTEGKYGKPENYWQKWQQALENGAFKTGARKKRNGDDMGIYIRDETLYRVPNDAIYDAFNTVLKMAEKRADMDATLKLGASALFSQDEEMRALLDNSPPVYDEFEDDGPPAKPARKPTPKPAPDRRIQTNPGKVRPPGDDTPWQDFIQSWGQKEWGVYWGEMKRRKLSPDHVHEALGNPLGPDGRPSVKAFAGTKGDHNQRIKAKENELSGWTAQQAEKEGADTPPNQEPAAEPRAQPVGKPFTKPNINPLQDMPPVRAPQPTPSEPAPNPPANYSIIGRAVATANPGGKPTLLITTLNDRAEENHPPLFEARIKTEELRQLFGERVPNVVAETGSTLVDQDEYRLRPVTVEWTIEEGEVTILSIIEE